MIGSFRSLSLFDLRSVPYSCGSYTRSTRGRFLPLLAIALLLAAVLVVLGRARLVLEALRVAELHVRLAAREILLDCALHETLAIPHYLDNPLLYVRVRDR